jgi:hypothetical protein
VKTKSVSFFPSMVSQSLQILSERILQFDEAQLCSLLQTSQSVLSTLKEHLKIELENGDHEMWTEIRTVAEDVVYRVASRCEQIVCTAEPSNLRLLVAELIYLALPAHDLVDAIEEEVKHRLAIAAKLENATSDEVIIDLTVKDDIEAKENPAAPWSLLRASLRSFLPSYVGAGVNSTMDRETAEQMFIKAESLRRLRGATGLTHSFHSIFELGRCLELVQEYKLLSRLWDRAITTKTLD